MNRMITLSTAPPTNPDRSPSGTPITIEIPTATRPTRTETRVPYRTRVKMSRPTRSVPKGCANDGLLSKAS